MTLSRTDVPTAARFIIREKELDRRQLLAGGGKLALLAAAMPALGIKAFTAAAQEDEGEPVSGGTITILRATDALNLTPGVNSGLADIAANFLIYDALIIKDFDGNIQPALAESWESSPDGLTWTFHLRRDVAFHSGEPFTSAHVVDHFTRWKDRPTAAKIVLVERVEAPDDYTVVFTLTTPTLVFLNNISQTEWAYASIPNMKKVAEAGDSYGVTVVDGTGPYILEEWVPDDHMTLARNPNYTLRAPVYNNPGPAYPERVIIRIVPEAVSRTSQMETGEADIDIDVAARDVSRLQEMDGITVDAFSRISSNHIFFNMEKPLFQDINVRKAITHAVNRQEITEFVMFGQADPAQGYLHPEVVGANPREQTAPLVEYNPDLSRQLLEEAGWTGGDIREKDGQTLSFSVYLGDEMAEQICQVVQAHLRDVGIDMQIVRMDAAALSDATQAGEHDAGFRPMIYTTADHLYFFITDSIPSPNTSFYSNPDFDALFKQSQETTDEAARIAAFQAMEMHILENAIVVPIQHQRWIFARQERVKGVRYHNIHGIYKFLDTWVE